MSDLIKSLDNLSMNTDNKTPKDQVLYNKKFKNVPKIALETNGHSETNGHLVNNLKSSSIEDLVSKETKEEIYQLRYEVLREQISKININELTITEDDLKDKFCDPDKPVRITFNDISAAAYRIKGGIENTPCTRSHMSELTGMEIYFKKDFLQYTGSFKERGARYALLKLSKEQKLAGVVAASAGNHAQALCYHGKQLKIPVLVVMPRIAPIMKISNCRSYGSLVLVEGIDLTESKKIALKLSKLFGMVYINGYDHPDILAGQGTMALEIIEQVPDLDAIIIPTGGGGLLAGVSTAAKAIRPDIRIISAESIRCPGFYNSCKHNATTFTKCESTLADGLAVSLVGANAFASANPCTDKSVCVSEEYIAIAILRLLELEKAVVEGAGATGFAAVLEGLVPELKGKKVVIPITGGNIDTTVLGRVLERALVADGRLVKLWVTISDRPGSLAEFCKLISSYGASIKDMYHERAWLKNDIFSVQVQAVLEVVNSESGKELENAIRNKYEKVVVGSYST